MSNTTQKGPMWFFPGFWIRPLEEKFPGGTRGRSRRSVVGRRSHIIMVFGLEGGKKNNKTEN